MSQGREFAFERPKGAGELKVIVKVYPDEFYNRFFKSLASNPQRGLNMELIKLAIKETNESPYILFEKVLK